ncbi:SusC/RagA family TonB-linked outer membrane protein [Pedobacter deserti]|uniref:SusC/RagA family TonB-linked outer membrane protein n=1 Tax=Pedobacter deserti TaxID=2817382 RepID=UPI00210E9E9C|nr:SusC/RagA family TonB-linked outer membrane protein [Pedobacter sp. SYSU D00382]
MRLTIVIILACLTQVSASSFAQNITIKRSNASVRSVLKELEAQSGYDVFYRDKLLKNLDLIDINVTNRKLEDVLQLILSPQNLTYIIDNKTVIIKQREQSAFVKAVVDTTVRGVVIDDATRKPVSGVTITLKGRTVVTKEDGTFSFPNGSVGATITAKYLGYKSSSITITELNISQRITIRLEESNTELKTVEINNGLFTRESTKSAGITKTISGAELLKGGTVNIIQSLRNLEPSMMVIENNVAGSNPNALPEINVRGATGLPDLNGEFAGNPNLPLFILDGFETSLRTVLDLDIYRVASVTLLVDAASKAIYGSRAGNGVIVIETVRPAVGQIQVSYNNTLGYEVPDLSSYNLTNARQKLDVEVAAGIFNGATATEQYNNDVLYNEKLKLVLSGVDVDWMHKPLRNAFTQNHSINIYGGEQSFMYGITGTYRGNNGVMKGSGRNNLAGNIQLTYRPISKKALGLTNYNVSITNNLSISNDKSTNSPWGDFSTYASMNPYMPYTNTDGSITDTTRLGALIFANPAYNATLNSFDKSNTTTITNNTSLNATLFKGFVVNGRFSFTKAMGQTDIYLPAAHTTFASTPMARKGSYNKSNANIDNYGGQLILTYSKAVNKNTFTINGAADLQSNSSFGNGYIIEGFPNERLNIPSLGLQYALNSRLSGTENVTRTMGLSGVLNYSYDNKYVLDGSYNGSQSSQFGENARWGQFWSLGARWNAQEEEFLKNVKWLDQLSIQASTGYTGTQGFNSSMSLGSLQYIIDATYNGANGATLTALANPDLRWQRVQDHNFSIQIGLFRKFRASFNPYIRNTAGALTDINLPLSSGFTTYKANLGRVQNKGYQASLNYSVFQEGRNFLQLTAGFQYNENTLKELSNALLAYNKRINDISSGSTGSNTQTTTVLSATDITRPKTLFFEGQSMDAIYAVRSLGIDPSTGRELYQRLDGTVTYTWNANDQVPLGNTIPKFNSNFGFNLSYNGFLVNATFRLTLGGQMYNSTLVDKVENANIYNNVDLRVLTDRWKKPGDVAFFKNIADQGITRLSSRFVEDNNQLTLGALNVTYELDRMVAVRRTGISRLRVGLSSNELFTIQSMQIERGTSYPFSRSIQFTLNANF